MIFVSNYFIKKLKQAIHFYVDDTFLYPNGFSQLLVILYRDVLNGKRFSGLFALINSKKEEGYTFLFRKILFLPTIENTSNIKLESYTIYFEKALINNIHEVFKNIRQVGCYYHYTRKIREKAIYYNLLKKDLKTDTNLLLKELYRMPFIYQKNRNILDTIRINYSKNNKIYEQYLDYFETQWIPFFQNGLLNYHYLAKEQWSNNYIENYNRRIKLKLSRYLFGKNHCKIS